VEAMKIEGHYDKRADIAWLRFEYWDASRLLPAELLKMLPSAPVDVAR
jgi:hypothetical protein